MGRTIRLWSSALIASASISILAFTPGAASASTSSCTFNTSDVTTSCTVGASLSKTAAESIDGTYWLFILNNVTSGTPTSASICWSNYCLTGLTGQQMGDGSWHFIVPETSENTDSNGMPITPTSATAYISGNDPGANFVLSGIPGESYCSTNDSDSTEVSSSTDSNGSCSTDGATTTTEANGSTTTGASVTTEANGSTTTQSNNSQSNGTTTTIRSVSSASNGTTTSTTIRQVAAASGGSTTTVAGATVASSGSNSSGTAQQSSSITVPGTNTGELWANPGWKFAVAALGILGSLLVFPWRKRRAAKS